MTEAEWLTCKDPAQLIQSRLARATDRKWRLSACACCDLVAYQMFDQGQQGIRVAERYADGEAGPAELDAARLAIEPYHQSDCDDYPAWLALGQDAFSALGEVARSVPQSAAREVEYCLEANPGETGHFGTPERARDSMKARCAAVLRDVLGNPFRPVEFSPSWRTDTATALARTMYEARKFGAMPILADALQDAGCDNDDVLNHCRAAYATHVRGCWVVDLVLGKE